MTVTAKGPPRVMLGEATHVNTSGIAQAGVVAYRIQHKARLRRLVIGARCSPNGGGASDAVLRVVGYIGEPVEDFTLDGPSGTTYTDDSGQVPGRKFCDMYVGTADKVGMQDIPLNFPVSDGETAIIIIGPAHGNAAGAGLTFAAGVMLLGENDNAGVRPK